ncbi:MAG: hypothetical protein GX558_07390 [Clostridiales bacterium]|nr:hypothetical protein [Clostridiales bacterium]
MARTTKGLDAKSREVERALYRRAVGFQQREEKTAFEEDGKGGVKEKKEVTVKEVPPDLPSIQAWLKARAPDRWGGDGGDKDPTIRVVSGVPRPNPEPPDPDGPGAA